MRIKDLFVEGSQYPIGIDEPHPLFSWDFEDTDRRAIKQTAYRIIVAESMEELQEQSCLWDSGKVSSARNTSIPYEGIPLQSRTRYYWQVQVWDQDDVRSERAFSWWETGLLHAEDLLGQWISCSEQDFRTSTVITPMLRKEFAVSRSVSRARLYICGLGHYELRLNGETIDDRVLDPGWTDYDKTCYYTAYDVTNHIRSGANAIGIVVGNGFFNVAGGRYAKFTNSFGQPRCLVQLMIQFTDGSSASIVSDEHWTAAAGPLTFSCIYGGEDYDARLEQDGWDRPGFAAGSNWKQAAVVEAPKGALRSQQAPPLKITRLFKPVEVKPLRTGVYVFDFGQNFSGWVKIALEGNAGAKVKMIPGEMLNADGTVNQQESGAPYEWNYTLRGEGSESWRPSFTYYGFRYVQVEHIALADEALSESGLPRLLSVEGQMIHPDIGPSGSFECSDHLLNRTHEIINWAILSNMKSVFTDCPHREKLGWLEQTHLMGPAIIYNYPVETLMSKVMQDIRDAQLPDGMVPTTAPEYLVFDGKLSRYRHSVSWGGAYILNGWNLFRFYGNRRILETHYAGMKAYIDYLESQANELIIQDGLGDWYDIGANGPGYAQNTPVALTETAMFYEIVSAFARIADILGRTDDAHAYRELSERIKAAFQQAFFNPDTCRYGTGSQTSLAMPLALGMVEEHAQAKVLEHLLTDIAERGYHTTAGDVGHRYVLLALARHNRSDVIYRMTRNTDYPSYGFQIVHGATTLTEAWDGPVIGKSQNHFMLGHLEEWLYSGLAGLQYEYGREDDTYRLTIKPYTNRELKYIRATTRLPAGTASMLWNSQDKDNCRLEVRIPVNCKAIVHMPAAVREDVTESGLPLDEAPGVTLLSHHDGHVVLSVESGSYFFSSTSV